MTMPTDARPLAEILTPDDIARLTMLAHRHLVLSVGSVERLIASHESLRLALDRERQACQVLRDTIVRDEQELASERQQREAAERVKEAINTNAVRRHIGPLTQHWECRWCNAPSVISPEALQHYRNCIYVLANPDKFPSPQLEASGRWQPMETAPKDGTLILVWAPAYVGLSAMFSLCAWHPDAGLCIDELRQPTHWMPLPDPPARREGKAE